MKRNLQTAALLIHCWLFIMLVGVASYETFINFPNWFADIPASLLRARAFLAVRNPGQFFQLDAPLTILTGVLFVLIAWRAKVSRNLVALAVALLIGLEVATFSRVYPRLRILLGRGDAAGVTFSTEQLQRTANEFLMINRWRLVIMWLAAAVSTAALVKFLRRSEF